jgi:succinate dehydrogenase/fumarate reductase flavoprotein subunit
VTFTTGLPDPRDPTGRRALLSQNPSAIWVNSAGQRFISETAPSKDADDAVLALDPATHWLIFDAEGLKSLRVRDGVWLGNPAGIEPLKSHGRIRQAETVAALASAAGLPPSALEQTVERWNAAVRSGTDADFGRFTPAKPDRAAREIARPPYYAMQLFPMTRKSMGGLAIDADTRVVDGNGRPIPGLYAAGEVTGVAGINGSYGGEGTFLGPSVYLGRLAGQAVAGNSRGPGRDPAPVAPPAKIVASQDAAWRARAITLPEQALAPLIGAQRPGYWHFEVAHRIVGERGLDCTACHTPEWPTRAAVSAAQRQVQLNSCSTCH